MELQNAVALQTRGYLQRRCEGPFFQTMAVKLLALKSEKCYWYCNLFKERFTALFCVSIAVKKEVLLVIGKASGPPAFKNIRIKEFPAFLS